MVYGLFMKKNQGKRHLKQMFFDCRDRLECLIT